MFKYRIKIKKKKILPISPCFAIGCACILRISRRACSLGNGISEKKKKKI